MTTASGTMPAALTQSEALMRSVIGDSEDIHYQSITLQAEGRRALVIYIEGMVDRDSLGIHVLDPLMSQQPPGGLPPTLDELGQGLIRMATQMTATDPAEVRDAAYRGFAIVLVDGYEGALILGAQGWKERAVEPAPSEGGLRGPRDGFVENISINLALIRRRLCDPNLHVEYFRIGSRSKTRVALVHMQDVAPKRLVEEMRSRLAAVEWDGLLDADQLRELLLGPVSTPFPLMESTERPDRVVAALLGAKVALVVDNSPFVLEAPTTLADSLWAADDYYSSTLVTSLVRLIRVLGTASTLFLPPLYIGVEMFTPGLVRSDLALYLARERAGLPLTPAMEVLFLEIMMEVLYEATVRLPSKVGSTATVVGGLIIGQAAVQARLVSGIVVIVVAIAAVGSFSLPVQEISQVWRAIKWIMIIAAAVFGVYGIFAAAFMLLSWLASLDSFGTPYLAPLVPLIPGDLARDSLVRKRLGGFTKRGKTYRPQDPDRASRKQETRYKDGGER